ncbi:MAG: ubiquinol-cytochrome c reductase iron-sulfur subunit [Acidimicrobiia bacterium]
MSVGQAAALGIALVAVMSSVAIFALAWRRERVHRAVGKLDQSAAKTPVRRPQLEPAKDVSTQEAVDVEEDAPAPDEPEFIEITEAELGETRRKFLTRATGASFGAFMAFFGITSLAFVWPRLKGGFGGKIDAGKVDEIKAAIFLADGTIQPFYVAEAKTYVMPFAASLLPGTDFESFDDVVVSDLVGLYQKCVHLGCRVPWCASSQGFECPCHGSKYNAHGEYAAGPAPRNLDRFALEIVDDRLIINTGQIRDTPRAKVKTIPYPQGVNCV